jgi:hypothetical protein
MPSIPGKEDKIFQPKIFMHDAMAFALRRTVEYFDRLSINQIGYIT